MLILRAGLICDGVSVQLGRDLKNLNKSENEMKKN